MRLIIVCAVQHANGKRFQQLKGADAPPCVVIFFDATRLGCLSCGAACAEEVEKQKSKHEPRDDDGG